MRKIMNVRRNIHAWRLAGGFVLFLGAAACGSRTPPRNEKSGPAAPATIDVVHVVEQPVDVTLAMPGELEPYQTVAIYPRVTGFVKTIRVDRGSRVSAGEVIATL